MFTKIIFAAASVAITGAAFTALAPEASAKARTATVTAANDPDLVTRRVSYADLNLASLPGERALNRRVGSAVDSVCSEILHLGDFFADTRCRIKLWSGARPQISSAVMRARQIAQTGHSSIAAAAITLSLPQ